MLRGEEKRREKVDRREGSRRREEREEAGGRERQREKTFVRETRKICLEWLKAAVPQGLTGHRWPRTVGLSLPHVLPASLSPA